MPALGAGMDIVSEGELRRALAAGVPAERIVFSGIGKTKARWRPALDAGILCFNVECEPELEALSEVATAKGRARADLGAGQPGCRREDPPQDRDRQVGEQVRHPDRARARGLCPGGAAAGRSR